MSCCLDAVRWCMRNKRCQHVCKTKVVDVVLSSRGEITYMTQRYIGYKQLNTAVRLCQLFIYTLFIDEAMATINELVYL